MTDRSKSLFQGLGRLQPSVTRAKTGANLGQIATGLQVEEHQKRSRTDTITTIVNTIDRDYFDAAGVIMERGRPFTETDQENSTPVAIVNQKIALDYWPGQDPIGKRILLAGEQQFRQVIGVARNANYTNWAEPPQPCVYLPLEQKYSDGMVLYVRTRGGPQQIVGNGEG